MVKRRTTRRKTTSRKTTRRTTKTKRKTTAKRKTTSWFKSSTAKKGTRHTHSHKSMNVVIILPENQNMVVGLKNQVADHVLFAIYNIVHQHINIMVHNHLDLIEVLDHHHNTRHTKKLQLL